jgi:hypothetical protein
LRYASGGALDSLALGICQRRKNMNAALVSRTLALIPDRVSRLQSGSAFDPAAPGACAHPERITHLAQFLGWLGPLNPITKDDLRVFGLMTPYGKPAIALDADEAADELDGDADAGLDIEPLPQDEAAQYPAEDAVV